MRDYLPRKVEINFSYTNSSGDIIESFTKEGGDNGFNVKVSYHGLLSIIKSMNVNERCHLCNDLKSIIGE